jgi:hypothetical protein
VRTEERNTGGERDEYHDYRAYLIYDACCWLEVSVVVNAAARAGGGGGGRRS